MKSALLSNSIIIVHFTPTLTERGTLEVAILILNYIYHLRIEIQNKQQISIFLSYSPFLHIQGLCRMTNLVMSVHVIAMSRRASHPAWQKIDGSCSYATLAPCNYSSYNAPCNVFTTI